MEEVKPKVFVSSNNAFVTDAIAAAGAESTKDKNDADVIVCVMHCEATAKESDLREKEWKDFKEEVKRQFNKENNIPVVLVYTKMIGRECDGEDVEITQRLEKIRQELEIVSLTVVRNSIEFDKGKEELKKKLEQFSSAKQMSKIIAAREARKEKKEQADLLPSPPPNEQSQPVVQLPRKKIFIVSNSLEKNKDKVSGLIKCSHYDVVELQDEADVIVVAFNISDQTQTAEAFFDSKWQELKGTNKNVIFTFVSDVSEIGQSFMAEKDTFSSKLSIQQEAVKKEIIPALSVKLESDKLPQRSKICRVLLNYPGGEAQFGQALVNADKPVQERNASAVKPVSFFKYPEKRSFCHSRITRKKYADKNLHITEDEKRTKQEVMQKKLVLLFVNYMSMSHTIFNIGHVKGRLSRSMENELAENLMAKHEYANYKGEGAERKKHADYKRKRRATVRGKNYDRVASTLKEKLLKRYDNIITSEFLKKLIDLAFCADKLERGFFNYPDKQQDIQNILDAVGIAYWNQFERQDGEALKRIENLPKNAQAKFTVLYNEANRPRVQAANSN